MDATVANMALHHATDPAAMLAEMTRVTRPGGWVAITDEIEHPYEWMRTEHADFWFGFSIDEIEDLFGNARLEHHGYAPLGTQLNIQSPTSVEVADIGIFIAWGQVPAESPCDRRRLSALRELDLRLTCLPGGRQIAVVCHLGGFS